MQISTFLFTLFVAGRYSNHRHKDGRKKHCCLYCGKWLYKVVRHMKISHRKENDVKKGSKLVDKVEKRKFFGVLCRRGDFEANMKHAREKNEFLTVVRHSKNLDVKNYTPCINCHGLYSNRTLIKHLKTCQGSSKGISKSKDARGSRILLQESLAKDDQFKKLKVELFSRMYLDEVTNLVRTDEGLLLYAYTLYEKGGSKAFQEISSKLRSFARLLIEFRNITPFKDASAFSLIDPANWDDVIKAAKVLVGHKGDEDVTTPTLLLAVGRSLEAIACTKRAWGIRLKDQEIVEDARSFLELHTEYWHIYAKHAHSTINAKKDKTPEALPLTADIQDLRKYLLREIKIIVEADHSDGIMLQEWSFLQKLIVVRIITFNARRGGEATKVFISDWLRCDQWKRQEDIDAIEDPLEKVCTFENLDSLDYFLLTPSLSSLL